ncbi:hypothetical protein ABNO84_10870, partial [Campylobacter jejuni]
ELLKTSYEYEKAYSLDLNKTCVLKNLQVNTNANIAPRMLNAKIGAEIINRLKNENLKDHPYKEWILTYGSENFQNEAKEFE